MKTVKIIIPIVILLVSISSSLSAQTTSTWIGGTPGRATDWNCANNWKENSVPDENSQVIIPADRLYYPVLREEVDPIDALMVQSGAEITLTHSANLTILGSTGRMDGMMLFGNIENEGTLDLRFDTGNGTVTMSRIKGSGMVNGNDDGPLASLRME